MESVDTTENLAVLRNRVLEKIARFAAQADRQELEKLEQAIDWRFGRDRRKHAADVRAKQLYKKAGAKAKTRVGAKPASPKYRADMASGCYREVDERPAGDPEFERGQAEPAGHSPHEGHDANKALFYVNVHSATRTAKRLGMSKPTLLRHARQGNLIGWEDARGRWQFPAGQLDAFGDVLAGIVEVRAEFDNPKRAWWWLNEPNADLDGMSPLEALRQGRVADVIQSTQSFGLGAFS
ncbi:hypothetical protein [Salinisphaera hydrothermalis]|uniref:hypothetical protein n=1 Tax=Salinisphaera hydrothermalis TaxID=563188 RepID=UPI00334094B3